MAAPIPPPKKGTIQSFFGAISRPDHEKNNRQALEELSPVLREQCHAIITGIGGQGGEVPEVLDPNIVFGDEFDAAFDAVVGRFPDAVEAAITIDDSSNFETPNKKKRKREGDDDDNDDDDDGDNDDDEAYGCQYNEDV